MKTIEELLRNLARPEVLEFALASDRLPCAKVGGSFQPVDNAAPTTDAILQMLAGVGGGRHVDSLTSKPTQWTTRIDGLGVISISAIMRNDVVQARFTLTKREVPQPSLPLHPPALPQVPPVAPPAPQAPQPPQPITQQIPRAVLAPQPPLQAQQVVRGVASPHRDAAFTTPVRPEGPKRDPQPPRLRPAPPEALAPSEGPSEDDDDPTLTNERLNERLVRAPARGRVLEVPLEIELDDAERGSSGGAPRPHGPAGPTGPTSPTAPGGDEITTEIDVSAGAAPVVIARSQGSPQEVARAPAEGAGGAGAKTGEADKDKSTPSLTISVLEQAHIQSAPMQGAALQPITGMGLDELLGLARAAGATDLHIVAGRPALVRVAGELLARTAPVDAQAVERLVQGIVPPRLHSVLEANGSCDFALEHAVHARFRVNVSRQRSGFKVCLRLVPSAVPVLSELGLPETIASAARHEEGLILVTSPSAHGKTTTLAALVDLINRESTRHVITLEDPIEVLHPRKRALLSQREIGTHSRSFAAALKASLHEDPDVIAVGELRDTETMRAALSASETGHLVLGTMSTSSAAKAIDRVIDLFPLAEQPQARATLADALRLVVNQRLVPASDGAHLVAAVEVLPSSISLSTLIRENKTSQIPSLQQRGRAHGIVRLDESLAQLVLAKKIDLESARIFTCARDDLEQLVAQRGSAQDAPHVLGGQPPGSSSWRRPPEEPPVDLGGLLSKAGSLFGGKKGS